MLHCIPSLGGGGAEHQLAYLSQETVKRGIETHVAYVFEGPNLERIQKSGAVTHKLSSWNNYDPLILWQVMQIIERIKPQILQTWLLQMHIFGGLASILKNVPFILSERSNSMAYPKDWKHNLRTAIGKRSVAIVANSNGGKSYWEENKYPKLIKVIRNCLPFDEIESALPISKKNQLIPEDHDLIIFAGRYDNSQKNIMILIKAIKDVLNHRLNITAIFFGEGPGRDDLLKIQKESNFGNRLRILAFTSELLCWMKRADLFISVSNFEGQPNTVLEAVACKCPVVVSDIPAHREFLDDSTAFFVNHHSPEEIAKGVNRALANKEEALKKATAAYERVALNSPEYTAKEYIEIYQNIITREAV